MVQQTDLTSKAEDDLYMRLKELKRQMEFLDIQEEYIKDEMKNLKREMIRAQVEIKRVQSVPLVIGQFSEMIDQSHGIVSSTAGSNYYVRILSTLNRELLKPSSSVALHRHSHAVVDILPPEADSTVQSMAMSEKPDVTYADIGGMDIQKQEIKEAVELPLTHKELYAQIGIDPPSGVLLYGPPGTGKTMLAKAVANQTTATFIRMVGSEFVQKYLGEGPRMVRDVFRLARENAPSIVFIDEIDAIGTKRFDSQTGADREVQRILLELLNQMDGFDQDTTVKVIMATNRADTLDPALLRPGRLDRKIEFPLPDRRQKRLIFQTITAKMNLSEEVDLEDYVSRPEKISCADIAAICQEAGMQAVRHNRYVILPKDFEAGWKDHAKKKVGGCEELPVDSPIPIEIRMSMEFCLLQGIGLKFRERCGEPCSGALLESQSFVQDKCVKKALWSEQAANRMPVQPMAGGIDQDLHVRGSFVDKRSSWSDCAEETVQQMPAGGGQSYRERQLNQPSSAKGFCPASVMKEHDCILGEWDACASQMFAAALHPELGMSTLLRPRAWMPLPVWQIDRSDHIARILASMQDSQCHQQDCRWSDWDEWLLHLRGRSRPTIVGCQLVAFVSSSKAAPLHSLVSDTQ
ncbi:26S protease regulatory subunit 6B-like [Symbiodinium microadriaticum]|uniref:26S protease regulatory subunit 6B-like n=1 Tax=Symbiodinium microadriaticum TaxID=2951 RepID=A0A1Q9DQK1_SYMMI|nr:26S protease regulatory subunit 6B-like [Symbiodinium microadriaticum]